MILDSLNALPGCLPGRYRGIEIAIVDTSSEVGRRVLEYLFPGVDQAAYDDFGVLPSIVSIEAFILADDYRAKAKRLQAVFETPGAGLLIHPWLGPMSVILEEPARISFSSRELRMVRISARFKRRGVSFGSLSAGGFSALLSALSSMIGATSSLIAAVRSNSVAASVRRSSRIATSTLSSLQTPRGSVSAVSTMRAGLAASAPETPAALDTWWLTATAVLQVVTEEPAVASAIAAQSSPSPQSLTEIGMLLSDRLLTEANAAPALADKVLLVGMAAHVLGSGGWQIPYAEYASSQEALTVRAAVSDRAGRLVEQLEEIGETSLQAETSVLIRAANDATAAAMAYLNEVIGELPAVMTFRPGRPLDAWALAQHIAGNDPARLEEVYADIVARNSPRHPSYLDTASIEVRELT
ncbi:DNA circularization N-terminal domain-containing protein [Rhizobium sp. SL86]|uniref:DNA circularization N-terminal domain-containing protein n=1 Tax=Rhizobium sp. SL86 TaxID=2995148 RepID=UPI0022740F1C|nr:DNA circularization N-terminal domain-containing protein [Rhizobium sp. SL86]MCY1666239.1 DNA circularization N-terminal domain-containing protein [Rhizobium sp. SL86]